MGNVRTDKSNLKNQFPSKQKEWFYFTCGESKGYWSENLNSNWNFSPSYNVPGAPSMSIRILF
jgi:hypothetical protein